MNILLYQQIIKNIKIEKLKFNKFLKLDFCLITDYIL